MIFFEQTYSFSQIRDVFMFIATSREKKEYKELIKGDHTEHAVQFVLDTVFIKVSGTFMPLQA